MFVPEKSGEEDRNGRTEGSVGRSAPGPQEADEGHRDTDEDDNKVYQGKKGKSKDCLAPVTSLTTRPVPVRKGKPLRRPDQKDG